ncbi:hypothetical protein HYV86_02895 [Candidatus Woesearchaeota archaeon]|nr:hypothetical protein [Candidatus Woesearchaeota archaeon]
MEPYFEKNLIVNNRTLLYKGIFRSDEVFHTINEALDHRHYEKREKRTEELVTDTGRRTHIELRPYKDIVHYGRVQINIKVTFDNVTETVDVVDGLKRKFSNGDVTIVFDGWVLTEYEHRWTLKPTIYFLKGMINKYVYTFPLEASFADIVGGDVGYVYAQIRKLLDSYKTQVGKKPSAQEDQMSAVREEMEREIGRRVGDSEFDD